ncbi:MAG: archaetidylserine decarboxylase [Alicyclobacillus sp.]|nr:archaetidylserine decarboxylase [Alicyclobacillus sp.]
MMSGLWRRLLLHIFPKDAWTALAGHIAGRRWSRRMIPWYVRHFDVDLSDAERAACEYPSLLALFCRRLKPGARPLEGGVVSPVDGTVSELGRIDENTMVQAKGTTYTVQDLLADSAAAEPFVGGHYITLYLSPRDYHRIHMPVDGTLVRWRYVPGVLFPVNPAGVRYIRGLYTRNERLITWVDSDHGLLAVVKVGAAGVGSIRTDYGPPAAGPHARRRSGPREGTLHMSLRKGEELGYFALGSTVILLFEAGMIDGFVVRRGDPVRMGQCIAALD